MAHKILNGLLALMLVVLVACTQGADTPDVAAELPDGARDEIPSAEPDVVFQITGEDFVFRMDGEENPVLRVEQGQRVRIEFSSVDGFHDWVNDEFNASTERLQPEDGTAVVEFVADQPGEFTYYCSVGSHRAKGMEGTLIVE